MLSRCSGAKAEVEQLTQTRASLAAMGHAAGELARIDADIAAARQVPEKTSPPLC